jgi:hypothetical protein
MDLHSRQQEDTMEFHGWICRRPSAGRQFAALATIIPLAVLIGVAPLDAQRYAGVERISLTPKAGISLPTGRLADLEDPGASFGLRMAVDVAPRLALTADGAFEQLQGADLPDGLRAPDMRLWHYSAGVEARVLPPSDNPWSLLADAGLGATTFDSDHFTLPGSVVRINFHETYLSANGGLRLGYAVTPRITAFADGQAYWAKTNERDTHILANLDPEDLQMFKSTVTFPLTLGLSARL